MSNSYSSRTRHVSQLVPLIASDSLLKTLFASAPATQAIVKQLARVTYCKGINYHLPCYRNQLENIFGENLNKNLLVIFREFLVFYEYSPSSHKNFCFFNVCAYAFKF